MFNHFMVCKSIEEGRGREREEEEEGRRRGGKKKRREEEEEERGRGVEEKELKGGRIRMTKQI
jgi:hypothetical protein